MYQLETRQGKTLPRVRGDVDFVINEPFREVLDFAAKDAASDFIVDLGDCGYIDSSALTELIRLQQACGDRVTFILPQEGVVHRIVEVTGMDHVLNVKRSIAEALSWRVA